MTFQDSISTCFKKKYFNFSGRASRSEFWFFILFFCIVFFASAFLAGFLEIDSKYDDFIFYGVAIPFFFPLFAVTARRLHDTGISGWWQLFPNIPAWIDVNELISVNLEPYIYIVAILFLIWCCKNGDKKTNRFGKAIK